MGITGFSGLLTSAPTAVAWRLRIRDASTIGQPNGTTDAFAFTSLASSGLPYIASAPTGDGAEVDALTGVPVTASYRVTVIDAGTSSSPPGIIPVAGVITAAMGDTTGRNVFLSRRCYLEQSYDSGVTWAVACAGYINRLQLVSAATYEFSIGETRRLETSTTIFQTIMPSFDQGTCVLGGPIGGTPNPMLGLNPTPNYAGGAFGLYSGQKFVLGAPQWSAIPSYVPGQVVTAASGIQYICTAGNTNDPPPDIAHWQVLAAGLVPVGVWVTAGTYSAGQVVVGNDSNAYLAITSVPAGNPPPNATYWAPLQSVLLPSWSMVQDYGGVTCSVVQVSGLRTDPAGGGKATNALKMTITGGWFRIPVKDPGDPTWGYHSSAGGWPKNYDYGGANALIPSLCSAWGASPVGYGGTYVNPAGGMFGINVPRGVSTTLQGGVADSVMSQLGWTIGGIALQVSLPTGQVVTTGAYVQLHNSSTSKGARYTATPVLVYPTSRNILVDWHDFYRLSPTTGQAILPLDQFGASVPLPPINTVLSVKAVVVPVSAQAPLHVAGHPIDLIVTAWSNAGIQWDPVTVGVTCPAGTWSAAVAYTTGQTVLYTDGRVYMAKSAVPVSTVCTNTTFWTLAAGPMIPYASGTGDVRSLLGSDLVLVLLLTSSMTLGDFWTNLIGGPLGVGLYVNAAGVYAMSMLRKPPEALTTNGQTNGPPCVTWSDDDCYGDDGTNPIFDLDEQSAVTQVGYSSQSFVVWDETQSTTRPLDDVVVIPNNATFDDADYATYGPQQIDYTIPGGFASATMQFVSVAMLGQAQANYIFERFGRGATIGTLPILATSPQATLGDLVVWDSVRMPNPAINQRGGPRLCQVIKKTASEEGTEYVLQDLGPAEQPAQVTPTFTLALDPADTQHIVDVTFTNAATLEAAYPKGHISVQYAMGASAPGTNAHGLVAADLPINQLGPGLMVLPPVPIGTSVWVRAQARPGGGQLPSLWSAWANITTTAPNTITGFTATDLGNGSVQLNWVNPDGTTPIQLSLSNGTRVGLTPTPTTVFLSSSAFPLAVGATFALAASAYDVLGNLMTGQTFAWLSSNPSIATVGAGTGLVTAVGIGTCTVKATDGTVSGSATVTVTPAVGVSVGEVLVSPNPVTIVLGNNPTMTAQSIDTTGAIMTGRTYTWNSSNPSVATIGASSGIVTPVTLGVTTFTATDTGVGGAATATIIGAYTNLTTAARAAGSKFLLSVNQSDPNDNFNMIGGKVNTTVPGLPWMSTNYALNWLELEDQNWVTAYSAGATAICPNIPGVASITSQMWLKGRVRVDELRALAASTGAGTLQIDSDGAATNGKFEVYWQANSAGTGVQLSVAPYKTGAIRITVASTSFILFSALPPNGCYLNWVAGFDSVAGNLTCAFYDDGGIRLGLANSAFTAGTLLNTDGGANGRVTINHAFNVAGVSRATRKGGVAIYAGLIPVDGSPARWQPGTGADTGLVALWDMADSPPGQPVVTGSFIQAGAVLTMSGTVTGAFDVGSMNCWSVWPNGPGGICADENQWKEFHFVQSMTGPGTVSLAFTADPTTIKARGQGTPSRAYLMQGSGTQIPAYATYVTNLATAKQALTAIVGGIVTHNVQTFGTAAEGGIREWNCANEFINGGGFVNSIWQTVFPVTSTDTGWVGFIAQLVHSIDPTATLMFNFNNIHGAGTASQKTACRKFIANLIALGIPPALILVGEEFHMSNAIGYSAADGAADLAHVQLLAGMGVQWCVSEGDNTDKANPGSGPPGNRIARMALSKTMWLNFFHFVLTNATAWNSLHSLGSWQLSSITSWLNTTTVAPRADGEFEEACLLDENYNRAGGAGSPSDVYDAWLSCFALHAA